MKKLSPLVVGAALTLFSTHPGFTQTSEELKALKSEIEALKQGQTIIQKELLEIKNLLLQKELQALRDVVQGKQAPPTGAQVPPTAAQPQTVALTVDGAPFKGDKNAKVTLIEFSDYQCPFCARHFSQTVPEIEKDYIQTGKVKYVFRDFPIESLHPQAFKGHEAANCAGEQGKYWEIHGRLFANQRAMSPKELSEHAQGLRLDLPKFQQCLDSGKYSAKIRKDQAEAQNAGVTGTPTFFLGLTEPNSSNVKGVRKLIGAQPYTAFKEAIDGLLSAQK